MLKPPHGDILPLSKVPFLIIFPATSVTCSSAVLPPDPVSVSVPVSIVFVLKVFTGEKLLFDPSDVLIRQKYVIPFSKLTSIVLTFRSTCSLAGDCFPSIDVL